RQLRGHGPAGRGGGLERPGGANVPGPRGEAVNEAERARAAKFRQGIFVLVAVLAFLGTIYALGARARLFESRYTIYADFTQVAGLAEGATVRLAGIQIGRVSGITLSPEPGGKVRVKMSVTKQYAN